MASNHLTDADLQRLRRATLTPEQIRAAGEHLAACDLCAAAAARAIPLSTSIADEHPPIDELFAYVDGTLPRERRNEVDAHLAGCRICREDVADARAAHRSMQRRGSRTPWLAVAAALLVAAAVTTLAVWVTRRHAAPAATVPTAAMRSLAVMPLQNLSPDHRDDFLSVALADALTARLEQIPSLLVPPTSAVVAMRARNAGIATDGIITGEFDVAGNAMRAKLQLTDARTHAIVWTTSFEVPRDDLAALVDAISERTLTAVTHEPVRAAAPHSANPAAFREYLQARALKDSLVASERAGQVEHLRRAIERDPNFAAAYADLALAVTMAQVRSEMTAPAAPTDAERDARKAILLDPDYAPGHVALARAIVRLPGRFREAMQEEATALRLNARDTATLSLLASYLSALGDSARVECVADVLEQRDPTASDLRLSGYWYLDAFDHGRVLAAAAAAMRSPSTALAGADLAANEWLLRGDLTQAQRYADQAYALDPNSYIGPSLTAMIAAARGDAKTAHAALARFEANAKMNHFAATRQALCYARLGERNAALLWTERAADLGNHYWYFWTHHPWLQPLQSDPRFAAVAGRMRADVESVQSGMTAAADAICAAHLSS